MGGHTRPIAYARPSRSTARFHPGKSGLDLFQEAVVVWLVGEALPWSGNVGIQDYNLVGIGFAG